MNMYCKQLIIEQIICLTTTFTRISLSMYYIQVNVGNDSGSIHAENRAVKQLYHCQPKILQALKIHLECALFTYSHLLENRSK